MRYPVTACLEMEIWVHQFATNNDIAVASPINRKIVIMHRDLSRHEETGE
jgi:hypothetical protein